MRHSLMSSYTRISVIDLHGSLKKREACPDGSPDANVFDIEPGVAISLKRRGGTTLTDVRHADLWGPRQAKYAWLLGHSLATTATRPVSPLPDFYVFVPRNEKAGDEYRSWPAVTDVFLTGSNGIQTSRDDVVYGFTSDECRSRIAEFRAPEDDLSTSELRSRYWPGKRVADYLPGDTRGWALPDARESLRGDGEWERRLNRALYRPLDFRALFYADYMIDWPRTEVMRQILSGSVSLCVGRAGSAADGRQWNVVFCADCLVDMNLFYRGGNVNYPLWLTPESMTLARHRTPNLKAPFLKSFADAVGVQQTRQSGLPENIGPEDIFSYAYAVFHSPSYRARYAEFLEIDFPRVPLPGSLDTFRDLSGLGAELVALHLMDSPRLDQTVASYVGPRSPEVERVGWSDDTVWLDAAATKKGQHASPGTSGFHGVPEDVWDFHIGGYQVCEKWLKDRKGRTLSEGDIAHYQRVTAALAETIRLMREIDEAVEADGGWPGAFQTARNVS
jgi:predicted helicase